MTKLDNVLPADATLRDVLVTLDRGVHGIVFVVAADDRLLGVLTDGDVRRAFLRGATLADNATAHMNRTFVSGDASEPRASNLKLLDENVRHLPLLDEQGRVVDYLSWAGMWKVPAMEPSLGGNELTYVSDCVTSGWISSQGHYVELFEREFAEYLGTAHARATSSGTSALHLALASLGIGAGDEVIVPDFTFGACANSVLHSGATPVFVDVDRATWTLQPELVAAAVTPRTRAILAVHLYGHPCDMDPLMALARSHDLRVVEDCAQAIGARYRGRTVGTIGDAACFSFFSNKVMTTGEGGMVATNAADLADRVSLLRDHGMHPKRRYWHTAAGFNYRMTNMQAAIGVAQLEKLDEFLAHKRSLCARYARGLQRVPGLEVPRPARWAESIHWFFTVLVDPNVTGMCRDELAEQLRQRGIETRPVFYPLHVQPAYSQAVARGCFAVTEQLAARGLSLPSGNQVSLSDVDRVCDALVRLVGGSSAARSVEMDG